MDGLSVLLVAVIVTGLAFDFTNGFHDTANSMATSIATGALAPRTAVVLAGVLNLAGAFLSTTVARTISGGIVDDHEVTLTMIFAGLLSQGSGPPWWVTLGAGLAISLGTYAGGWRIIRTMGRGLTDIESPQGFTAETTAATVVLVSSHTGFPLSTTQVCAGGILGSGLGRRLAQVRWGVAGRIAVSWVLTLPAAAAAGGVAVWLAGRGDIGPVLVAAAALAAVGGMYALSRRRPVHAGNVNAPTGAEDERADRTTV
ncbi:anion permease [Streptomyces angustmyceticus]|uniref:inorganic phosphate transporter n=1 Tax=Streptomyces angustmyceticus TaxID=285578 RepID=UPI003D8FBD94